MYFLGCISVRLVLFCKRYRDMVKEGLMKKLLVLSLVFACMTGNAQVPADSVVMTVAGKQIPLDEFIFIAQRIAKLICPTVNP